MANTKLGLTRDQFAAFLQDHEQIKQFENLFALVDTEVAPNAVTEATILAGTAEASAANALAQIASIKQNLDYLVTVPAPQNNNSIATDYIDFSVTDLTPAPRIGRAFWDGGQTLNVQQTLNVAGKINEDNFYYIKADSTITKGQLVMFTGSVGASGVLKGAPATGLGINDGVRLMGIAAEDIATNDFGMVQWSGVLRGFDTTGSSVGETWADGDILYYNPAYAGGLTKNEPVAPNVRAVIAAVVNAGSGGSGSIAIRLSVGSVLGGTDSNVYINGLTGGDLLQYDGTDSRWENIAASSVVVGTATNIAGGSANQLVYQTAPSTTSFATVGSGLLLSGGTLSNSAPDQTVTLTAGTGISVSGTYPNFTITNSAPDQTVSLTGAGTTVVTGTYPNFTITSNDAFTGTVTSVAATAGTGISVSGSPITTSGTLTITNTAPDQTVVLTQGGTTTITGTYPNFTISSADQYDGTVTSVSGTGTVNGLTLSGTVTSSGSLTLGGTLTGVDLTSQVTGTLPVGNGGTGTATAFTAGSVVFAGASGVYSQDNANFFWDDTNNKLGIGNTNPGYAVDVSSSDTSAGIGYAFRLRSNATAAAASVQFTDSGATAQNGVIGVNDSGEMKLQADGGSSAIVFYLNTGAERFRINASGAFGLSGANYGTSGQVLSSQGSGSSPAWLSLATVATSGSFSDLSNKPGIRSNGQNVIAGSKTLGSADSGTNILIVASGITITFPSTGFASGEGFAISNVSGGNVTLSTPGGADFGSTLPNNGTFFAFCDGGGFWRQYCYSTSRL